MIKLLTVDMYGNKNYPYQKNKSESPNLFHGMF